MLVVLDNARSAEQVRSLLPGAGSGMVVVPGRDDLTGLVARNGAHRVEVDVLPLPNAVALLRGDDGASATLAERYGRLPLALRVAALAVALGADADQTAHPDREVPAGVEQGHSFHRDECGHGGVTASLRATDDALRGLPRTTWSALTEATAMCCSSRPGR
jgi:hypothetical protein